LDAASISLDANAARKMKKIQINQRKETNRKTSKIG